MNARAIFLTLITATFAAELVAATVPPNGSLPARDANSPHRSLSAIQIDVHAALRAEAVTRRRGQNAPEVVRLIALYREMAAHPQRDKSAMLAKLGLRLRSRLKKVRDHIERNYKQTDRGARGRRFRPLFNIQKISRWPNKLLFRRAARSDKRPNQVPTRQSIMVRSSST